MAKSDAKAAEAELIAFAATFPGAWEDHPWDHTVMKVGKKVFVFFGGAASPPGELSLTVKLPVSYEMALTLPYMSPAGHGLWKGGWAALRQRDGDDIDLDDHPRLDRAELPRGGDEEAGQAARRARRRRHERPAAIPRACPFAAGDGAWAASGRRADLRVGGKIFAVSPPTAPGGDGGASKLHPRAARDAVRTPNREVFRPVDGDWARSRGWTRIVVANADDADRQQARSGWPGATRGLADAAEGASGAAAAMSAAPARGRARRRRDPGGAG